jgi:hypothetical protein
MTQNSSAVRVSLVSGILAILVHVRRLRIVPITRGSQQPGRPLAGADLLSQGLKGVNLADNRRELIVTQPEALGEVCDIGPEGGLAAGRSSAEGQPGEVIGNTAEHSREAGIIQAVGGLVLSQDAGQEEGLFAGPARRASERLGESFIH